MAPRFKAKGYCVYALTYRSFTRNSLVGRLGLHGNQCCTALCFLSTTTNTTKPDFVGHSQGSLMPRYYLKFLGGATKVDKFAGFANIA